jgi:hypothetical protein
LFRLLQASSSIIFFSQILHFLPFRGLRPDFLIRINFHGISYTSIRIFFCIMTIFFVFHNIGVDSIF